MVLITTFVLALSTSTLRTRPKVDPAFSGITTNKMFGSQLDIDCCNFLDCHDNIDSALSMLLPVLYDNRAKWSIPIILSKIFAFLVDYHY